MQGRFDIPAPRGLIAAFPRGRIRWVTLSLVPLLAAGLLMRGAVPGASSAPAQMQNSVVSFSVAASPGSARLSLVDRVTGAELVSANEDSQLYQIDCDIPGTGPVTLSARDATAVTSQVQRTAQGQTTTLTFKHGGRVPLAVQCRFTLATTSPEVRCDLTLTGLSAITISAIRYPVCAVPLRLGAHSDDDRLLLPLADGAVIEDPERNTASGAVLRCQYPGMASLQLCGFYDGAAGLYVCAYDGAGHRKALGFRRGSATMTAEVEWMRDLTPAMTHTVPYAVALGVFHGDWRAAADRHRVWAMQQSWCRTPVAKRADVPSWLRGAPLFYVVNLRGPQHAQAGADVGPGMADYINDIGTAFHTPVAPILIGWERQGPWVSPDYFPPYSGDARFRAMTAQMARNGHHPVVYLSGLKWTLKKSGAQGTYDDTADFAAHGRAMAVLTTAQAPLLAGTPTSGTGQFAWLCPAVPATQQLLCDQVRQCQAMGVSAVQVDQLVGGGTPPCYATNHGHPRGGGTWSAEAVRSLLARLSREGKWRDRNFALLLEEPCEFFLPVIDAYHAREYAENRWPRDATDGMRGVPLFTHVYHAYGLAYGGDAVDLTTGPATHKALALATNLVEGKLPAAAVWERHILPGQIDARQASLTDAALRLIQGPARDYLLGGTRMSTGSLAVPEVDVACVNPATGRSRVLRFPAVRHTGWSLPDGRLGYILANYTTDDVAGTLTIAAAGARRYDIRVTRPSDAAGARVATGRTLPYALPLQVPSGSALLVEAIPR